VLLSTDIWVGALIRRVAQEGAFATVARKGDTRAGAVLIKTCDRRSGVVRLFAEAFGGDGERVWMEPVASVEEAALDAYVERALRVDPDLWVVEIEDADGARFLTERVENR